MDFAHRTNDPRPNLIRDIDKALSLILDKYGLHKEHTETVLLIINTKTGEMIHIGSNPSEILLKGLLGATINMANELGMSSAEMYERYTKQPPHETN